jgi:hypothetical protein
VNFVFPITIPANTPSTSPVIVTMSLTNGTVTKVDVQFPGGVIALAHVTITNGLYQVFPSNQDADFATNDETITWPENLVIDQPPFGLQVNGWNDDDTYQHTITVRVVMQPAGTGSHTLQEIQALLNAQGYGEAASTLPPANEPGVAPS